MSTKATQSNRLHRSSGLTEKYDDKDIGETNRIDTGGRSIHVR